MQDQILCESDEGRVESRRLILRPPTIADAVAIAAFLSEKDVATMLARAPHPYGLADAEAFLSDPGAEKRFALTLRKSGTLVGLAGLDPKDGGRRAILGYWVGKAHWGAGFATEAVQAVVDYGFEAMKLDRIDVSCRVVNAASRRVIVKCGFFFYGPGMIDTLSCGRVASEHYAMDRRCWEALRSWGRR